MAKFHVLASAVSLDPGWLQCSYKYFITKKSEPLNEETTRIAVQVREIRTNGVNASTYAAFKELEKG